MRNLQGLIIYEIKRISSKKSFYFIIIIALLPLITSLILRKVGYEENQPYFWLQLMGTPINMSLTGLFASTSGIVGFIWIIGSLFGGDLFASDIKDESIYLILSKPLTRADYVYVKISIVTAFYFIMFALAGIVSYFSGHIVAGSQDKPYLILYIAFTATLGTLPLTLISAVIGLKTGNPTTGILSGIGVYFLSGTVASVASLFLSSDFLSTYMNYSMIDPIRASLIFPWTSANYIVGNTKIRFPGLTESYVDVSKMFYATLVNILITSILLVYLIKWIFSKKDI